MSQKGFVHWTILVVVLIAVVAITAFNVSKKTKNLPNPISKAQSTPTPHLSPDIKLDESGKKYIYVNHIFNYSLKYPKDWQITEHGYMGKEPGQLTLYPPGQMKDQSYSARVEVFVNVPNPRTGTTDLEKAEKDFNQEYAKSPENGLNHRQFKVKNLQISNQKAVQIGRQSLKGDATESSYSIDSYFIYGAYGYSITFVAMTPEYYKENQVFYDQILRSFQFLGPKPTIAPITTKLYENKSLGISFEYQSNWLVNSYQNNGNYDKGFTVVDENDYEVLSLYEESRVRTKCPQYQPPMYYIQFYNTSYDLYYDCDHPRVRTSTGKELKLDTTFFGKDKEFETKGLRLLKSIKGIEIIQ